MLIRDESRVGVNGFGLQPFELQVLQMGLIFLLELRHQMMVAWCGNLMFLMDVPFWRG